MSIRTAIADWLDPQRALAARRYHRLVVEIEQARWWLGSEFPDVAAFAEMIYANDYHWITGKHLPEPNKWSPPPWIHTISDFREWLREKRKAA